MAIPNYLRRAINSRVARIEEPYTNFTRNELAKMARAVNKHTKNTCGGIDCEIGVQMPWASQHGKRATLNELIWEVKNAGNLVCDGEFAERAHEAHEILSDRGEYLLKE